MHVFISYSHNDAWIASTIKSQLESQEFVTWIDEDISPGEKWSKAIDDAIESSFALVVIVTQASRQSEYVTYEWSFALGRGIPVIPVILQKSDMHPKLSELQYVDYSDSSKQQVSKLISKLKELQELKISEPKAKRFTSDQFTSPLSKLFEDLNHTDHHKRRNAAQALGNMKEISAVPYLLKKLDDKAWSVRLDAVNALGKIRDKSAVPALLHRLHNDKGQSVRLEVIWALGQIGDEAATLSLCQFASWQNEKDIKVRHEAVDALSRIGDSHACKCLFTVASAEIEDLALREMAITMLGILATLNSGGIAQRLLSNLAHDARSQISDLAKTVFENLGTDEALDTVNEWLNKS